MPLGRRSDLDGFATEEALHQSALIIQGLPIAFPWGGDADFSSQFHGNLCWVPILQVFKLRVCTDDLIDQAFNHADHGRRSVDRALPGANPQGKKVEVTAARKRLLMPERERQIVDGAIAFFCEPWL